MAYHSKCSQRGIAREPCPAVPYVLAIEKMGFVKGFTFGSPDRVGNLGQNAEDFFHY
jgi:hypothetical protein